MGKGLTGKKIDLGRYWVDTFFGIDHDSIDLVDFVKKKNRDTSEGKYVRRKKKKKKKKRKRKRRRRSEGKGEEIGKQKKEEKQKKQIKKN